MKKILKTSIQGLFALFILYILHLNIALYHQEDCRKSMFGIHNEEVYTQLQFLKEELHEKDAGRRMQDFFPEGFVFINALYGLTWIEIVKELDHNSEIYKEAILEIDWAINEVNSETAKQIFSKDLEIEYGVFYQGWSNYLKGRKLELQNPKERKKQDINDFFKGCQLIKEGFENSKNPYLSSVPEGIWPADNMLCFASLATYDRVFAPKYQSFLNTKVTQIKESLDPTTGLIPHYYSLNSSKIKKLARGSSQSLILNFLPEFAPKFAKEQFLIYKKHFLDYRFGLPGIREYPQEFFGLSDVDSGPVILGVGGSASIVGMRTMALYKETTIYKGIRNSVQGFGMPWTSNGQKSFLFKQLPMADAFIAWSNSLNCSTSQKANTFWRLKFQIISLLLIIFIGYVGIKI